jgi:hypothetical protein
MKVIVRKLENIENTYFAYLKGMSGKGTYLLYFEDNIYGAICLHNFIEMLKNHFKAKRIEIAVGEKSAKIKSQAVLSAINQEADNDE